MGSGTSRRKEEAAEMMPVGELTTEMFRERQRAAETLGRFCGLQDGQSAWAC
jgi:hypothetical protein